MRSYISRSPYVALRKDTTMYYPILRKLHMDYISVLMELGSAPNNDLKQSPNHKQLVDNRGIDVLL